MRRRCERLCVTLCKHAVHHVPIIDGVWSVEHTVRLKVLAAVETNVETLLLFAIPFDVFGTAGFEVGAGFDGPAR